MKNLVVDTRPVKLTLLEGSQNGRLRVRGEFARAGVATENKRVYSQKIWEAEIGRLNRSMTDRKVLGELDHPSDGRTSLARVSHIVTNLKLENGILVGEAEILDTDKGRNLAALLKANVRVGVSSRGYGSTKTDKIGEDTVDVVQEDYRLVTFDFVAEPADSNAYPDVFFEGVDYSKLSAPLAEDKASDEEVREGAKKGEAAKEDEKAEQMLAQLGALRASVYEQVRTELLADPEVAAAKAALERVKEVLRPFLLPEDAETVVAAKDAEISRLQRVVAERDLKIKELETDNAQLTETAKEIGFRLFLERALAGNPKASMAFQMMGDLKQFESAAALKARFEEVKTEIDKQVSTEDAERSSRKEETRRAREEVVEQETKIKKLTAAVSQLLEAVESQDLKIYAQNELRGNPRSARITQLLDQVKPTSKDQIDSLIEANSPKAPRDADEASDVRSRVRRTLKGGGRESAPLEEEARPRRENANYNDLGMPLADLKALIRG